GTGTGSNRSFWFVAGVRAGAGRPLRLLPVQRARGYAVSAFLSWRDVDAAQRVREAPASARKAVRRGPGSPAGRSRGQVALAGGALAGLAGDRSNGQGRADPLRARARRSIGQ